MPPGVLRLSREKMPCKRAAMSLTGSSLEPQLHCETGAGHDARKPVGTSSFRTRLGL